MSEDDSKVTFEVICSDSANSDGEVSVEYTLSAYDHGTLSELSSRDLVLLRDFLDTYICSRFNNAEGKQ